MEKLFQAASSALFRARDECLDSVRSDQAYVVGSIAVEYFRSSCWADDLCVDIYLIRTVMHFRRSSYIGIRSFNKSPLSAENFLRARAYPAAASATSNDREDATMIIEHASEPRPRAYHVTDDKSRQDSHSAAISNLPTAEGWSPIARIQYCTTEDDRGQELRLQNSSSSEPRGRCRPRTAR